ncbi:putative glycosidase CRH2 [Rhizina undulata]
MVRLWDTLLFAAAVIGVSADTATSCGDGVGSCPSDTPCCSQYGVCGVGAYCLGGCDPKFSNSLDSCVPAPICKNLDSTFTSLDRVASDTKYLGNSSASDWVVDGTPLIYNDTLLLTMAPNTVGTVMASSVYVWYGKISATLKTSRGAGVVTAFILLSDMKDEIDYEWVGVDLDTAQTNYYWQGIPVYTNSANISVDDTYDTYHTYEIDWTEDQITWSVDGVVGRTLLKSDTYNSTDNTYHYPQTPARVQLSLWPGGLSTNAQGTISWAGGEIDWNSTDIETYGYDFAMFKEVSITCYDPPSNVTVSGTSNVSYIYNNVAGLQSNVVISSKGTILTSLLGTGTNMTADYPSSSVSASGVAVVPGLSGSGTGANGLRGSDTTSSTSARSSSNSSSGFNQGTVSTNDAAGRRLWRGSLVAVLVSVVAVLMM